MPVVLKMEAFTRTDASLLQHPTGCQKIGHVIKKKFRVDMISRNSSGTRYRNCCRVRADVRFSEGHVYGKIYFGRKFSWGDSARWWMPPTVPRQVFQNSDREAGGHGETRSSALHDHNRQQVFDECE